MDTRSLLPSALALGVVLAAVHPRGAAAASVPEVNYLTYSGTATARNSGQFLYRERHVVAYRNGRAAQRVVLYTCRDGSAFARKTVAYVDSLAPDFSLEDASNGLREGVRSGAAGRDVFFRSDASESEKHRQVPEVSVLVADAGFDEFVRGYWTALMSGRPQTLHFLVPSRLRDVAFEAQHVRSDRFDQVPVEVFRLKVSGPWGWVLPSIDVYYTAADHLLVHYDGLSDLRNASDTNFDADITFPLGARKPSDQSAFEAALKEPIAPCR